MTIDPIISNYIDIAIERERKIFRRDLDTFLSDIRREMGVYYESLSDQVKLSAEITNSKAGKEEVREIVKDELRYHGLHR